MIKIVDFILTFFAGRMTYTFLAKHAKDLEKMCNTWHEICKDWENHSDSWRERYDYMVGERNKLLLENGNLIKEIRALSERATIIENRLDGLQKTS